MVIFFYPKQWFCLFFHDHRDFIETHYVPVKQSNPNFPILIRECSDIQPRVWARYGRCNFGNFLALAILEVFIKIDSVVCWMFWRIEAYCALILTGFFEKKKTLENEQFTVHFPLPLLMLHASWVWLMNSLTLKSFSYYIHGHATRNHPSWPKWIKQQCMFN